MGSPCCYGSGKRVRPVETVFFPELATSGGPGEDEDVNYLLTSTVVPCVCCCSVVDVLLVVSFTVELCEAVQVQTVELGNLELFSSLPQNFEVYISERFVLCSK